MDILCITLQVVVEGVGVQQFEDRSRQKGEGSVKWEAKDVRYVVQAGFEVLDLCERDVVEELDKKLTGDIGLITGKSFNCNEDGRGGNDKSVEGINPRC